MVNLVKSVIPFDTRQFIKWRWHSIIPKRVVLSGFVSSGCKFDVSTPMEFHRVITIGDEADFLRLVLAEIRASDVFYDIGSCLGLYALHAGLLGANVIAFEPEPEFRKRLAHNISINRLSKKVRPITWAVSDQKGQTFLFSDGIEGNSPSLRQTSKRNSIAIRTNSIDLAIKDGELPLPTIIKMDIEGAEILALRGMKYLLSLMAAPRYIFIEFHPLYLNDFGSSVSECKELIETAGYQIVFEQIRDNQIHYAYLKKT